MQVAWLEDQQPLLSVFVADGAGSVSQGGEGAMLAVNEAMAYMSQKVQGGELGLNDVLATDIVLTIRQRLFAEAEAKELAVRDFACTFLGLISSANGTLIMQIGDGGVVVDLGHGLQLPLTPMVGEYANMTHFITDDDAVSRLETYTSTERAHKVAAFTDGIQRLALNMLDNSPHVPFFTPFFNGLASATQEQLDLLPELLKQFLSEGAVYDIEEFVDSVAKIYHTPPPALKQDKLAFMAATADAQLLNYVAWPQATLHGGRGGKVIGFMMPKVSGKEPIHMIYSPRHIVARVTLTVRGIFYSMLRAILLHLLLRFTSTGTSWVT